VWKEEEAEAEAEQEKTADEVDIVRTSAADRLKSL